MLTRKVGDTKEILWKNKVPNAAWSLISVYLIREKESNTDLLNIVIKETDKAQNKLNRNGVTVEVGEEVFVSCVMKDSMKDMTFKKLICGLGSATCILCKSKVQDWTDVDKL